MKRKILILLLIGLIIMNEAYSKAKEQKTLFVLTQKDEPPFGAKDRLATKGEYGQEITFLFTNNSNVKRMLPVIYSKRPFSRLHINGMIIRYKEELYLLMMLANFKLPEEVRTVDEPSDTVAWVTDGEYYWLNGFFAEPERPNRRVCNWPVNLQ